MLFYVGLSLASLHAIARGQSPEHAADGGALEDAATSAAALPDETHVEVDPRVAHVRALLEGTLSAEVDPQGLFDVSLADEPSLEVERARVKRLLELIESDAGSARPSAPEAEKKPKVKGRRNAVLPPPPPPPPDPWEGVDRARLAARAELDRVRLEFYELSQAERAALLAAHAQKREAARARESEYENDVSEADEERQRVLKAAREARSEAERLVKEELARLIGIEGAAQRWSEQQKHEREDMVARQDNVFGWQRRVREAKTGVSADADATYDALRRALRGAREQLAQALDDLDQAQSELPELGRDPLNDIPSEVRTEHVRERRHKLEKRLLAARDEEAAWWRERAASLLDEVDTLNRERLTLLPYLSSEKRGALTGFTPSGLDQARAEARHLFLILRYHRMSFLVWLENARAKKGVDGAFLWNVSLVLVPWLLLGLTFFAWRKQSPVLLVKIEQHSASLDRSERRVSPSVRTRAFTFLREVHRPLEWLLFLALSVWLLPHKTRALLEIQLLIIMVGWSFGGSLIVYAVNALATIRTPLALRSERAISTLRLRSLRFVGRVIVSFSLILVLSARLLGEGTVHVWVRTIAWFAAVPVFLLLVKWWRAQIFERIERARRKSRLEAWLLANRSGWKSFLAAMIAAVQLSLLGSVKIVQSWLSSFDVARRAHAYLFKRELDRMASGKPSVTARALRPEAVESLSPERAGAAWVSCPADEHVEWIEQWLQQGRGGVLALVGTRGMGKSTFFRKLAQDLETTLVLRCDADTSLATIRRAFDAHELARPGALSAPKLALIDDVQTLIKPLMGGLSNFDQVLSFARTRSLKTLWIFAIDKVVWPFLWRARDSRPMFDQVLKLSRWSEEEISKLLSLRSAEADVSPSFEDLLEKLPPSADEIDRLEALEAKRAGYHRMVWDYARGNPAIALEVWRSSLCEDREGVVRARPLQVPQSEELESLPDSALFILRAILQMTPASIDDVALATRLTSTQIESALRYGQAHGYLLEEQGRVRIAWPWLRAVLLVLERRHLLGNV